MFVLEAIETSLVEAVQPKNDIYFGFTHDEETFGTGAKSLAKWFEKKSVFLEATLDEGSFIVEDALKGLDKPVALIGIAEKGYASYQVTFRAKGGHSSIPLNPVFFHKLWLSQKKSKISIRTAA